MSISLFFAEETRPIDHQLVPGELEHAKEFVAAEKRKRGRPPKGQERPRQAAEEQYAADEFDDEEAAPEESDPSYYSGEVRGKKRGRGEEVDQDGRRMSGGGGAGRAPRAAATPRGRWEEDDEEAEAQRLLAQAQGQARALQDDAAVRDKVRNVFTTVLETAAQEVTEADPAAAASLPKPAVVATTVEDALVRLYGV